MANPASTAIMRITRTLPASRERVFAAFTEPALLQRWWGPAGFTLPEASVDLRVGGRYRFGMQPAQGDRLYLVGTFREIKRPERLVYTWSWEGAPGAETIVTVEFFEAEGDTEVVVTQEPFPDAAERDQHRYGWDGGLDRLTEIVRRETRGKAQA